MTDVNSSKHHWTKVKFGDVVRLSKDRSSDPIAEGYDRYIGLDHIEPEDLRIRRWGNVADGVTFTSVFKPGQVLFGKRRAYQRKVAVADFAGVCSGDIYVLESKDPKILLPDLLPFICQTEAFFQHAVGTSAGSLSPRTNWTSLADFQFTLPPWEKQAQIVELLSELVNLMDAYNEIIISSESLWKARTSAVFKACQKKEMLGPLTTYSSDGPFGSKLKTEHYSDCGVRVIRLNNIGDLEFDDSDRVYIPKEYYEELKGYKVQSGDIIIAGLGDDRIPMGRACVIPESLGTAINKADCFCIRLGERLLPQYLVQYFNSKEGLSQARSLSQGTTRKRLNLGNIRRMQIPLPTVLEQENIASELQSYKSAQRAAATRKNALTALRRKLIEAAMDGTREL